ncbi:unnamed protein product, partial [Iphiclides podalirius]
MSVITLVSLAGSLLAACLGTPSRRRDIGRMQVPSEARRPLIDLSITTDVLATRRRQSAVSGTLAMPHSTIPLLADPTRAAANRHTRKTMGERFDE